MSCPRTVLLLLSGGLWAGCDSPPADSARTDDVNVPVVNWPGMEPQVAAKIQAARQAVLADPTAAQAWVHLGMCYHAHDFFVQAAFCYQKASEMNPKDYRWPYLSALALRKSDIDESARLFDQAARLHPTNPAVYVNYADTLLQQDALGRARAQYQIALQLDDECAHASYGLGQVAFLEGDMEEALARLRRAVAIAPHHHEVHTLLAQVYHRLGDTESAEREEFAARAYPDPSVVPDPLWAQVLAQAVSSRSFTSHGLRLARGKRYAEAERQFRKVLEIRPGKARDYANLGAALAGQGKLEDAIAQYQQALRIQRDEPYAHNNLAMAFTERGRLEEAAAHLAKAIRADPAYADAYFNLGLVRERQGYLEQAIQHFRQALRINPALGKARNNLAKALATQGHIDEAIDHWKEAVAVDPQNLDALYNLGMAFIQVGRHREAVTVFRQGVQRGPNSSLMASALAWELSTAPQANVRDGAFGVRLASRVHDQYPDRPETADLLAAALAELGDFETATQKAEQALALARSQGRRELVHQISKRLEGYRKRRPYRQPH